MLRCADSPGRRAKGTEATGHVQVLRDLLQRCHRATEWLETAASVADNPQLRLLFRSYAEQHAGYRDELQSMLGDVPALAEGSMPIGRSELTDAIILERTRRTERDLRSCYETALAGAVPDELQLSLRAQYHRIRMIEKYLGVLDYHP